MQEQVGVTQLNNTTYAAKLDHVDCHREYIKDVFLKDADIFDLYGWIPPRGFQLYISKQGDEFHLIDVYKRDKSLYGLKITPYKIPAHENRTLVTPFHWETSDPRYQSILLGLTSCLFDHLISQCIIVLTKDVLTWRQQKFCAELGFRAFQTDLFVYLSAGLHKLVGVDYGTPIENYSGFYYALSQQISSFDCIPNSNSQIIITPTQLPISSSMALTLAASGRRHKWSE